MILTRDTEWHHTMMLEFVVVVRNSMTLQNARIFIAYYSVAFRQAGSLVFALLSLYYERRESCIRIDFSAVFKAIFSVCRSTVSLSTSLYDLVPFRCI